MILKKMVAKNESLADIMLKGLGVIGHEPDFYITGIEKCGTTTLYNYLIQHPEINGGRKKECFYYDKNFHKGLQWYKGFFPKKNSLDGSPTYYRYKKTMKRISLGKKHIMILREPVSRFESAWNQSIVHGWDKRTFAQIWEEESPMFRDGYIYQCLYHDRIHDAFEILGKESIHVVFLEELKTDPWAIMNTVFKFLNVSKFSVTKIPPQNKGKKITRLLTKEKKMLDDLFKPQNLMLSNLLRRNLPW